MVTSSGIIPGTVGMVARSTIAHLAVVTVSALSLPSSYFPLFSPPCRLPRRFPRHLLLRSVARGSRSARLRGLATFLTLHHDPLPQRDIQRPLQFSQEQTSLSSHPRHEAVVEVAVVGEGMRAVAVIGGPRVPSRVRERSARRHFVQEAAQRQRRGQEHFFRGPHAPKGRPQVHAVEMMSRQIKDALRVLPTEKAPPRQAGIAQNQEELSRGRSRKRAQQSVARCSRFVDGFFRNAISENAPAIVCHFVS